MLLEPVLPVLPLLSFFPVHVVRYIIASFLKQQYLKEILVERRDCDLGRTIYGLGLRPPRKAHTHMCVIYMAFIYLARRAGSLILYYTVCIRKVSGGNGYRFVRWYKNKTSICRGKRFVPKVFFSFPTSRRFQSR